MNKKNKKVGGWVTYKKGVLTKEEEDKIRKEVATKKPIIIGR